MKENIKKILKIIIFISFGVLLFWLVYRKQDWHETFDSIKEADWRWLFLSALLGILSHISRVMRWKLMLKPLGYNPRINVLFYSVMIMYVSNLAIPRSGEIIRCSVTSEKEKIPFSTLLGTVVTERIIDVLILFVLMLIAFITQFKVFIDFINSHEETKQKLNSILNSTPLIVTIFLVLITMIILAYAYRGKIKQTRLYKKFEDIFENFAKGIKSFLTLEKKWIFIAHSIFIWTMYFVMIYVCFWAFDFTSHLTILAGLTVFVMASLGMVAPSPGGIGTWHFMAIETLVIYGIDKNQAKIFAFASHETQILMLITVGLLSLLAVSFVKNKNLTTQKS